MGILGTADVIKDAEVTLRSFRGDRIGTLL